MLEGKLELDLHSRYSILQIEMHENYVSMSEYI